MIDKGNIPSIQCKMSFRGPKSMRKVNGMSLIFFDFYVPVLTPRLSSSETSLELSENITLCSLSRIYRCHQQRDVDRHQVFGVYHTYYKSLYNVGDSTEPCGTLLICPLA
jgi:hypothetical protein